MTCFYYMCVEIYLLTGLMDESTRGKGGLNNIEDRDRISIGRGVRHKRKNVLDIIDSGRWQDWVKQEIKDKTKCAQVTNVCVCVL